MHFVPAHKQADEATTDLSPAEWPMEFVLIANQKKRGASLCHDRIHSIPAPAIQTTYRLTPTQPRSFPRNRHPRTGGGLEHRIYTHPRRPIRIRPATLNPSTPLGPDTLPRGRSTEPTSRVQPNLGQNTPYTIPTRPLKIAELCGGLATGLEAFLKAGYKVAS